MKEQLDAAKNEEEIDAYDILEEKLMDINLKIVGEIANDEYYLVEKTTRKLTHKLEKMKISKYTGEFSHFHNWSSQFLTYTDGLDDVTKRAYLVDALEGKAEEFVGDLIESEAEFDELWKRLKGYFGNKRYVKEDAINAIFHLESPTDDADSLFSNFTASKNNSTKVNLLDLQTEELLAAVYVRQLPPKIRTELEQRISNSNSIKDKAKYTFEDIEPLVLEMIGHQGRKKNPTKVRASVALVTPNNNWNNDYEKWNSNSNNYYQPHYQRWRGYRGYCRENVYKKWNRGFNYRKFKSKQMCEICGGDHKIWECCYYNHGQEMREILQRLDRCDACLQKRQYHLNGCYNISWGERPECFYCV